MRIPLTHDQYRYGLSILHSGPPGSRVLFLGSEIPREELKEMVLRYEESVWPPLSPEIIEEAYAEQIGRIWPWARYAYTKDVERALCAESFGASSAWSSRWRIT